MKPWRLTAAAFLFLWSASPAAAQDRKPLARGDAAGTAGWLAVNKPAFDTYNDWHAAVFFTAGAGWYWTDHLKTDVEVGATTESRTYRAVPVDIDGRQYIAPSIVTFGSTRVALIQRYQFGRNQWFHPSLGAGIDIVRERYSQRLEPIFSFDQPTRQSRLLRDAIERADEHELEAHALVVGGFKAYFTPRAFFLGDLRVAFASRAEDTLLRIGFGVDF